MPLFDFPSIGKSAVQDVLLTTKHGRCFAPARLEVSCG